MLRFLLLYHVSVLHFQIIEEYECETFGYVNAICSHHIEKIRISHWTVFKLHILVPTYGYKIMEAIGVKN